MKGRLLERLNALSSLDDLIDSELRSLLDECAASAIASSSHDLPIYDVLRYHLGFVNAEFRSARFDPGKRIRPRLCISCCDAAGGMTDSALPIASAIELIHNFTLIHDDIQDKSDLRRHRPTVWSLWGNAQAINAGDAMFAASHLALNRARKHGVGADRVLELSTALHRTTLRIVEGQVLDLSFEKRRTVSTEEYLTMIRGKTAAIMRYACWSGARVAGVPSELAETYGDFGESLGIGFQVRDDLLGVWGDSDTTGKPSADDIRRRKKALPILALLERATQEHRVEIIQIYSDGAVRSADVARVLELMNHYDVYRQVQSVVRTWHDHAIDRLHYLKRSGANTDVLETIVESLIERAM